MRRSSIAFMLLVLSACNDADHPRETREAGAANLVSSSASDSDSQRQVNALPPEKTVDSREQAAPEVDPCGHSTVDGLTYSGSVSGYDFCEYVIEAEAGQEIAPVFFAQDDDLSVILYSPEHHAFSFGGPYKVTETGTHQLRVLQPRSQARREKYPKDFKLRIVVR
jgi:hypothetical protein